MVRAPLPCTLRADYSSSTPLVLITGTTRDGIGFEAARVIAKYANLVIITGHNPERYAILR